jgi:Glutathione S-transferase, N-terminal domain
MSITRDCLGPAGDNFLACRRAQSRAEVAVRPVVTHPESPLIRFYFNTAPNPVKVALMLEELGQPYEAIPVDTAKGEQHAPAFRAINPNG